MISKLEEKYPKIYYYLTGSFCSSSLKEILSSLETKEEYDFIEKMLESGDSYSMCDYFKKEYRDFYGSKNIISNFSELTNSDLDYGLSCERAGEVIKFLLEKNISLKECSSDLIRSSLIDIEYMKKISPLLDDVHFKTFIMQTFSIKNEEDKEFLEKALVADSYENTILNTIVYKYNEFEQRNYKDLLETEDRESLSKFLKLIPDEYFNDKSQINRLVKIYNKCRSIVDSISISDISNELIKKCFKCYILDVNRDNFSIKNKEDLLDIFNIRDEYYLKKINSTESIDKIKSYISQNFFGMRFKEFYKKICEVQKLTMNMQTTDEFSIDEYIIFSTVSELGNYNTKKELLNYYDRFRYFWSDDIHSYFDKLDKKVKGIYQKNLVNGLTELPKGFQKIYYDGEDFEFLVHKVVGLNNRKYAKKISKNPSSWKDNTKEFIDVSYISGEHFGIVYGSGLTFIFNNVKPSEIVAMGVNDIYTNYSNVCSGVRNLKEEWMLKDELKKKKLYKFDNHVIKKEDGRPAGAFIPNGILCFDEASKKDTDTAKIFDVPVVIINREKYLEKINDEVLEALNKKQYSLYYIKKTQMFMSAYGDKRLVNKYFSGDVLDKEINDYIKDIDVNDIRDLKMLSTMFKVNRKITISLSNSSDIDYRETDMTSVVKKVLKK